MLRYTRLDSLYVVIGKYVTRTHMYMYFLQDVRRKVARVVAAKCTLAARVDSFHESPEGEVGQGMQYI